MSRTPQLLEYRCSEGEHFHWLLTRWVGWRHEDVPGPLMHCHEYTTYRMRRINAIIQVPLCHR